MDRTTDYNSRFVLSEGLALLARPKLDEGGRESLALSEVERVERVERVRVSDSTQLFKRFR
jgi:hypothetical protein